MGTAYCPSVQNILPSHTVFESLKTKTQISWLFT